MNHFIARVTRKGVVDNINPTRAEPNTASKKFFDMAKYYGRNYDLSEVRAATQILS